ncbi:uncharacterized protein [Miscanthus floridulus]|uniref:uncharacterized protein isoform X2 n=1 Tax=Miscanthus floridulus TaxID=154761 RepID=UPI00345B2843
MPAPPSESGAPLPDPRRIAAARGGTVIRSRPVSPRWAPALSAAAAPPLPPAPPRGGRSDARHVLLRLPFLGPLRDGVHVGHQDGVLVHCFAGVSRSRRRASWEPGAVENLEVSLKHIRSKRIKCYLISSLISKVRNRNCRIHSLGPFSWIRVEEPFFWYIGNRWVYMNQHCALQLDGTDHWRLDPAGPDLHSFQVSAVPELQTRKNDTWIRVTRMLEAPAG